jgi:hypothetical protein
MSAESQQWAELVRLYKVAKAVHETIFWRNLNKFTARFDGKAPAGATVEEIAQEEKAREALEDVQFRMRLFVEENVGPT